MWLQSESSWSLSHQRVGMGWTSKVTSFLTCLAFGLGQLEQLMDDQASLAM